MTDYSQIHRRWESDSAKDGYIIQNDINETPTLSLHTEMTYKNFLKVILLSH